MALQEAGWWLVTAKLPSGATFRRFVMYQPKLQTEEEVVTFFKDKVRPLQGSADVQVLVPPQGQLSAKLLRCVGNRFLVLPPENESW